MTPRIATYVVVESALLAAYIGAGPGLLRALTWQAMIWSAIVVIAASIRHNRPAAPRPWWILVIGMGLLGLGALSDPALRVVVDLSVLRPVFDTAMAVGFPLIGVAALGFARAQSRGRDRGPVLDSAIVTVALTTVYWEAALSRHDLGAEVAGELAVIFVVSATSSWVAAMNLRAFLAGGYEAPSGWAMLGSAVLVSAGAGAFVWLGPAEGTTGSPPLATGVMWIVALILLGVAALHPSMRWLTDPQDVESAHTVTRTVLAGVALLMPATAILLRFLARGEIAVIATFASLIISVIVIARYTELVRDLEQARAELRRQSLRDPLTGLANRMLLDDRLAHALARRPEPGRAVGVAFLDLDGFKEVNDRLGHAAGDDLLREVATRLTSLCRSGDTLARFGGDEFVMVLDGIEETAALERCEQLLEAVATPIELEDELVAISASIGLAFDTGSGRDPQRLLVAADDAMYRAKRDGRGRVRLGGEDPDTGARRDRRADAT